MKWTGYKMKDFTFADHIEDLDAESKYLAHKAKEATQHAYAPYSKFHVGAAVLLDDGTVITGTNQENAAYPSGMCAERVALYAAAAQHPDRKITKLAVVARKKTGKELVPATSCGNCRQVMLEFEMRQQKPMQVVMMGTDQRWIIARTAELLLPFSFHKGHLDHDDKK
ncbi:MAG: cytidine deaminase [Bacteroidia bacterium]|nr:cytidine deaminase [Bacteroidia bacterium]